MAEITVLSKVHYEKMTTSSLKLRLAMPKSNDDAEAIKEVLKARDVNSEVVATSAPAKSAPKSKVKSPAIEKELIEEDLEAAEKASQPKLNKKQQKAKDKEDAKALKLAAKESAKAEKAKASRGESRESMVDGDSKFRVIREGEIGGFKIGDVVHFVCSRNKPFCAAGDVVSGPIAFFKILRATGATYVKIAVPFNNKTEHVGKSISKVALITNEVIREVEKPAKQQKAKKVLDLDAPEVELTEEELLAKQAKADAFRARMVEGRAKKAAEKAALAEAKADEVVED